MKRAGLTLMAMGLFFFAETAQAQWTPAKRLSWTSDSSDSPAVATDSGTGIHVVWNDRTPGNSEIYYRRSKDGGTNWSVVQNLTGTAGDSYDPAIAVDSEDAVHVFWAEYISSSNYDIYCVKSSNNGETWSPAKRLTWTLYSSREPAIFIDSSGAFHIVWYDYTPGNAEIFYKMSKDGGSSWSPAKRLTWTSESSSSPAIAVDSAGSIHVVWYDYVPDNAEVYYKRSADGGETWTPAKRLTWTSSDSHLPSIVVDSNDFLHIVWYDYPAGNDEVYYKKSPDGGTSWDPTKRLTWTSGDSCYPAMAIESGQAIHVVWYDYTPGNAEIFYRKSPDRGATWSPAKRLTWTSGNSIDPALSYDPSGLLHVVWSDYTYGKTEVHYKNGK